MKDRIRATVAAASAPDMDVALGYARTALDAPTRVLMIDIADKLSDTNPLLDMREVTRLSYAARYAATEHGTGTVQATAATGRLLRHMPRIDTRPTPITRGEYALLLRAVAGRRTPEAL
ncbi:hypothetical protein [[Kitasatospora] papulosa]|uniref:hypothetical protein n=1 Tax=[Kitasatospora] papulosa TaxID=1464011 RepID=UPI00369A53D3